MKGLEGLRSFCDDLASDQPAPGGGTAAAAAGGMAASLLVMVCAITRKSKRYEASWAEMDKLRPELEACRERLISLSAEDSHAYEGVVEAFRARKEADTEENRERVEKAIANATDVPQMTASECIKVLEFADSVAQYGSKSAYSDVGVAVLLANAGLKGALMNVMINVEGSKDDAYKESMRHEMSQCRTRGDGLAKAALERLGKGHHA
jgi:glutamate formiminotransferase/formiminotetrahydrofolate cyclodeaminase